MRIIELWRVGRLRECRGIVSLGLVCNNMTDYLVDHTFREFRSRLYCHGQHSDDVCCVPRVPHQERDYMNMVIHRSILEVLGGGANS
jgi:hypothetical protein